MRVLHVITDLDAGGAEGVLYRLILKDSRDEHQVISLMEAGVYGPRLSDANVPVHALGMARGQLTLAAIARARRVVRSTRPDVIQTWMYHANLVGAVAARLAGNRTVVWNVRASDAHRHLANRGTARIVRIGGSLSRWLPVRTIFNSYSGAELHAQEGYDRDGACVIPNGFDLDRLSPDVPAGERMRARWGIPADSVLIGMAARWDSLKDHQNLFTALRMLKNEPAAKCSVALVGPGMTSDNGDLTSLLRQSGVDGVLLLGVSDDIAAVMNAFDIHVLSSRSEGFPNVLAEAMACGTPCVATDTGDAARIVGKTGWIVPARDAVALMGALKAALSERARESEWKERQAACRRRVSDEFSLERMVDAYRDVWRQALDHGR